MSRVHALHADNLTKPQFRAPTGLPRPTSRCQSEPARALVKCGISKAESTQELGGPHETRLTLRSGKLARGRRIPGLFPLALECCRY